MNRKLTRQQASDIRFLSESGWSINALVRLYGLSWHRIADIIEERTYADCNDEPSPEARELQKQYAPRQLTKLDAEEIRWLWSLGFPARRVREVLALDVTDDCVLKVAKGLRR